MPLFQISYVNITYVIERVFYCPTWLVYPLLHFDIFPIYYERLSLIVI